jgi:hypothetical protein
VNSLRPSTLRGSDPANQKKFGYIAAGNQRSICASKSFLSELRLVGKKIWLTEYPTNREQCPEPAFVPFGGGVPAIVFDKSDEKLLCRGFYLGVVQA